MVTSLTSLTTHLHTVATVTTFTLHWYISNDVGRRDKRGIIIRRARPEYRESQSCLVSSEILSRYAFHRQSYPPDENTKTKMFLLMVKHPAAGLTPIPSLLVNLEPGMKIKFLSLIYLRQNCNPTQYNTIHNSANLQIIGSCCSKKLVQWVYIIIVWSQPWLGWASIFVVTFNKHSKLAPVLTLTNTHSLHCLPQLINPNSKFS